MKTAADRTLREAWREAAAMLGLSPDIAAQDPRRLIVGVPVQAPPASIGVRTAVDPPAAAPRPRSPSGRLDERGQS